MALQLGMSTDVVLKAEILHLLSSKNVSVGILFTSKHFAMYLSEISSLILGSLTKLHRNIRNSKKSIELFFP